MDDDNIKIKKDVDADEDLYIIDDPQTYTTVSTQQTSSQWKISGSTSTNITVNGNNTISVGPDAEKQEKIKELINKQLTKLDELKDEIIKYISKNKMTRQETLSWKSDLEKIEGFERDLKSSLEDNQNMIGTGINEDSVLDPTELDILNSIYRRWK